MGTTKEKVDLTERQKLCLLMRCSTVCDNSDANPLHVRKALNVIQKLRVDAGGFQKGLLELETQVVRDRLAGELARKWPDAPVKKGWKYSRGMELGPPPSWMCLPKHPDLKSSLSKFLPAKPPSRAPSREDAPRAPAAPPIEPKSKPPEAPKVVKSNNSFTTALDEHKANLFQKGKKYDGFGLPENSKTPSADTGTRPTGKGGVLGVDFYGNAGQGEKREGPPPKRQFRPPFREDSKKEAKAEADPLAKFISDEGLDSGLVEVIRHEIIDNSPPVKWDQIAGLEEVKRAVNETIIFPNLKPELFTGLRKPSRGILLFGPPGTGKTMIGRAIAGQLGFTFFSISSSSLISKWVGESERLIRTLFRVAIFFQPSIIFVDEIDSMLSVRGDSEADVVRRIKTEFFVQIDGAKTNENDRLLVIGTTNRPEQLDEAARRRFTKRLYVPLPDWKARLELFKTLVNGHQNDNKGQPFSDVDLEAAVEKSEGYSCADILNVMKEAAMMPVRDLLCRVGPDKIGALDAADLRPLHMEDVLSSLAAIKASVAPSEIRRYIEWNDQFGTSRI